MKKQQAAFTKVIDDKYIPLEPKFKILIGVAIILLPIVLFFFLIFQPNQETSAALAKQEAKLRKEVLEARKKASNKKKFEEEFKRIEVQYYDTADMLPREKEIPKLLKDISGLGQNAGLDFLSFTPGKDVPRDFYNELSISINLRGPYHNMGFFLDQVSKLNRIVTVSNIKMSSPKKEGTEMILKSNCVLKTYQFTNKPLQPDNKKGKKKRRK